jgi:hypothetical protein
MHGRLNVKTWRYLLVASELYDFRHHCDLSFSIPETLGCCPRVAMKRVQLAYN